MQAILDFCTMQLQLASVFFTFSLGTRTHYFGRIVLHGGAKVTASLHHFVVLVVSEIVIICHVAIILQNLILTSECVQYRSTGRGFVVRHINFAENYRLFSRSHFTKA